MAPMSLDEGRSLAFVIKGVTGETWDDNASVVNEGVKAEGVKAEGVKAPLRRKRGRR